MEKLFERQNELGSEIQRIITNFKKDSAKRKTKKYYEDRVEKLQALYKEFNENDESIISTPGLQKTELYFQDNYYAQIETLVAKYIDIFNEELLLLEPEEAVEVDTRNRTENQKEANLTESVTKLRKRQSAMIASMRNLLRGIERLSEDQNIKAVCEISKSQITKLWNSIEAIHFDIWAEDTYDESVFLSLENEVQSTLIKLTAMADCGQMTSSQSTAAMLPKMVIPKFDGNYLKWPQFKNMFQEMVLRQNIPEIQKMWYLKSNVTGEAERLIRHLALTQENFKSAWNALENRYDNKRSLTSSILHQIMELKPLSADARTIRDFHDTVHESLSALINMGIPTDNWDPLLLHILVQKLDRQSHIMYEQSLRNPRELQTMKEFLMFLQNRFQALEALGAKPNKQGAKTVSAVTTSLKRGKCSYCSSDDHVIYYCKTFLKLKPAERLNWIQKQQLCVNCLKNGHKAKECTIRNCSKCNKKHNSLLHLETTSIDKRESTDSKKDTQKGDNSDPSPSLSLAASSSGRPRKGYVVLATARVQIVARNGQKGEFRAILDSGSQVNIISERVVKKLSISSKQTTVSIEGIGNRTKTSTKRVNVLLKSNTSNYSADFEALVLPSIVPCQPAQLLDPSKCAIPEDIMLADPTFQRPGHIDILLGAELYFELMKPEKIQRFGLPTLQNTELGWIVGGKIETDGEKDSVCAVFTEEEQNVDQIVKQFWELDNLEEITHVQSPSERRCEAHFQQTTTRNKDGRFVVKLPLSDSPSALGESKAIAIRRFLALERRLEANSSVQSQYIDFMRQYEQLGHMTEIQSDDIPNPHYFIPHHCVLKPESTTTKLRVVFDASSKTSSGLSLNNLMYKGPIVQSDLRSILLRFRLPRFVFKTDIEKMYRQILVTPSDQMLQLIVWRNNSKEELKLFKLNTVTYGTTAAPYLSTKCLQQLGEKNMNKYPLGARVLRDDFYVDDGISGSDKLHIAIEMQRQLTELLSSAGFKLKKWCANNHHLLNGIPMEDQEVVLDFEGFATKTLGLTWLPKADVICIKTDIPEGRAITRRTVTSDLAKIFDPLGLVGPVVVTAKLFIQQLWQTDLTWDEELPEPYKSTWFSFRHGLKYLNNFHIPRHVFDKQVTISSQIHTFVDASERAYGAAVYLRSKLKDGRVIVRLLCAKSRIAPIKKQSLPRLELCAALLGAELTSRVKGDIQITDQPTFLWTDSEIVLSWINTSSALYNTFVANRISKIQELTVPDQWRYVNTKQNPADLISRGIQPEKLDQCAIWFYGPIFLAARQSEWNKPFAPGMSSGTLVERKQQGPISTVAAKVHSLEEIIYQINHRNSFRTLQRIVGYVLRFIKNTKTSRILRKTERVLDPSEMNNALSVILKTIQSSDFGEELKQLKGKRCIEKKSPLSSLTPFLDESGVMRVTGRLENSALPYDTKHPAILPYNDPLVKLLVKLTHEDNNHCGHLALLAALRSRFWIIKGKTMARNIVQNCVRCTRARPQLFKQIMGNLPTDRVTPSRPFITSGVDYFGPVTIHYKIRGKKPTKAYVAVFCCFSTKAVHLELVSDLTTDAFIGALKRFISRRGRCKTLYCDNATNFTGANNKLIELQDAIYSDTSQTQIQRTCADKGIEFKFIPPRAPHFGGLWEAAVKSTKKLLIRSVSTAELTYEELETVIIEIEAMLNSRPLTPLSSDPSDPTALTPGHFLVGEPLTAPVDSRAPTSQTSLGKRWEMVSKIKHDFWKQWSTEYLTDLQSRAKWKTHAPNVTEGTMVILKDETRPVLKWPLGIIERTFPGNDHLVRVVDVKTANGIKRRPIHTLAPLFPQNDDSANGDVLKRKHDPELSHEASPRKLRQVSYSSLMTTIIISMLLLPLVFASPVKVTQFKQKPGIYFEDIGTTKLTTAHWTFMVFYDLKPMWSDIKTLETGISTLKELCAKSSPEPSCTPLINHFTHSIGTLIQEETLLTSKRHRRAALDIVGNMANALFGVLDSNYADDMSKTIENVKQNEDHLLKLLKNQTSVIDSTLNIIKRDERATAAHLQQLQDIIKEDVNKIESKTMSLQRSHQLIVLITQLSMIMTTLQQTQSELIHALTQSNNGNISPLILTPQQLEKELQMVKAHLPTTKALPMNNDNLLQFYKIMTVHTAINARHIIFLLQLPLVDQQTYSLVKLTPIPIEVNNTILAINPKVQFLAVNDHHDQYAVLSKEEFDTCTTVDNDLHVCPNQQVRYGVQYPALDCVIQLLNNKTAVNCDFSEIYDNISFIPLHHTNTWIFATTTTIELSAVCKNDISRISISGSGVITIDPKCVLKNSIITLQGHEQQMNKLSMSYVAYGSIPESFANFKKLENLKFDKITTQLANLTKLHRQLQISDLPAQVSALNKHHYTVSYSALASVILMLVFYVVWKTIIAYRRRKFNTRDVPQPAPRQQNSFNVIET